MDPLNPNDLPFADDDPDTTFTTVTTTATVPQGFTARVDAGDSKTVSQDPEETSRPPGDVERFENGTETSQTLSEASNDPAEDSDTVLNQNQKSDKEDSDLKPTSLIESEQSKDFQVDLSNVSDNKEVLNDERGDVNGDTQQSSEDFLESKVQDITIKQMAGEEEKEEGGDLDMEKVITEDDVPSGEDSVLVIVEAMTEIHTFTQSSCPVDELSVSQEDQNTATEETEQTETDSSHQRETETSGQTETDSIEQTETDSSHQRETETSGQTEADSIEQTESGKQTEPENDGVEISAMMDPQGETHGGKTQAGIADDLVDDFFSTSATAETVTNGVGDDSSECILRIDESIDSADKDSCTSRPGLDKESSPEIIIGSVDSVENVTLKDATSEKALLGNRDDDGSSSQRDSLSSRTDEDKRKSSSDMDMDFAVLELDSAHLNLDMSKQKTSLRKRGSLARRKKPSRGSVTHMASDSSDTMFQDTTDAKPLSSPTSDTVEDDVFDKHTKAAESQQTKPAVTGVRKAAQPFKPSLVMPGLQDLSKSKLFNQERKKSDEDTTPPVKSPQSPLSPAHRPNPPVVMPKPTSKIQKDSQNKTIAAENCTHSSDSKSVDTNNVSSNTTTSVEDTLVVSKEMRSDSVSSSEGPKAGLNDSGSFTAPKFMRADSWSSVSSPRPTSRRESMSSVEGGETSSPHSTPRRASIQGSAYAPMGFRPRRSSSIVLDSNNKLIDLPTPVSPAPPSPFVQDKDSEAFISSEVRSPTFAPPAWLPEVKPKPTFAPGDSSARLRTTSIGSNDGSAVSASSGRSRNSSGSADGVQGSNIGEEGTEKKPDGNEAERPAWVKAAPQTTSQVSDKLPDKKDIEENGEEERPVPPWAAELKKKKRPFVSPRISETSGDSNGKPITSPYKGSTDEENAPVVSSGRDEYSPSWMKTSQQSKKPPPPVVPVKPMVSSKPAVKPHTDNPMRQYETPKWKLELAEKKKRREAEMMPTIEDNDGGEANKVPQWKQQLSQRKKQTIPEPVKEAENGGSGTDWARQAEERRARLMKSGLFSQAETAEES